MIQMSLISALSGTPRRPSAPEGGVVLGKFISQRMAQRSLFEEPVQKDR